MQDAIVIDSSPEGPSRRSENNDTEDAGDNSRGNTATANNGGENTKHQFEKNSNGLDGNAAEKQPHGKGEPVILGGNIPMAAFCLLQGFLEVPTASSPDNCDKTSSPIIDNSNSKGGGGSPKPVLVPIDRLPAMLGRTHNTSDKNFFGLGKNVKALSRVQCCIEYRIPTGKIGQYSNTSKFTYQPTTTTARSNNKKDKSVAAAATNNEIILNPTNAIQDEAGFYVITCKGKNPIRVNGLKVDQDQTCLLTHGSVIKISSFCLYFLLPSTLSTRTMEITVSSSTCTTNPSKSKAATTTKTAGSSNSPKGKTAAAAADSSASVPTKKRKAPEMMLSTATAATRAIPKVTASSSSILSVGGGDPAASTTAKRSSNGGGGGGGGGRGAAWKNIQDELDKKSTSELLQQLHEADENGAWDRKCQFVGATVSYRAVLEAANSAEIQQALGPDGISKAQIVEWINTSHQFGAWAQMMQSKLEPKSYQSSIANAMRKAGFERSGSINFGRHVKWQLPLEFQKSGGSVGGSKNMVMVSPSQQKQRGESSSDDSDDSVANDSNNNDEESDGGDDDNELQGDDNEADSGGPDEESDNGRGSSDANAVA